MNAYSRKLHRYEAVGTLEVDADRITITLDKGTPALLRRIGDEAENMMLCAFSLSEGDTLYLMQPDFGMFAGDDELVAILTELFDEQNYDIIFKD